MKLAIFSRRLRDTVFTAAEVAVAIVFLAWILRETFLSLLNILGLGDHWLPNFTFTLVRWSSSRL
jgi:hypothetical protein